MECRIRKHDKLQFEIKAAYPLVRDRRRISYDLEMFLFLPYPLQLNADTYSRDEFFDDLLSYTRFKTPKISFAELVNPECAASPIIRIEKMIAEQGAGAAWNIGTLLYEWKVLAQIIRAELRDGVNEVLARLAGQAPAEAAALGEPILNNLSTVLTRMRAQAEKAVSLSLPTDAAQAWHWVDEYISLQVEELLLPLAGLFQERAKAGFLGHLRTVIETETEHRKQSGYPPRVSRNPRENEDALHHESLLKKFCAGVLFLSIEQAPGGRRARHALYAVVAGIAMCAGLAALWLANKFFEQNLFAIGVAGVVAYMFRDRLKEIGFEVLRRLLPGRISDRDGRLIDPHSMRHIGWTRESLRWLAPGKLPADVRLAGQYADPLERMIAEPTDRILHYTRQVRMDNRAIYARHLRAAAIDDILRMSVERWLAHMDNPHKSVAFLDADEAGVAQVRASRVYHVQMVVRLSQRNGGDGPATLTRARIVLSQRGIERVE